MVSMHLQELQGARERASAASRAVKDAEKALAALETAIPKTRMEAEAQKATATDLLQRLAALETATEVCQQLSKQMPCYYIQIESTH